MTYQRFKQLITVGVIAVSAGVVAVMHTRPSLVDRLAREDGPVEWLSALLLIAAAVVMIAYGIAWVKRKHYLRTAVAIVIALVFFVIAMEEISWGQRIFDIESSEFFLEHNAQDETNLHNLNTRLSEAMYYTGAFVLLVGLPFFRKQATTLLSKLRLASLRVFLPAAWLLVPFAAFVGFTGADRLTWPYVFIMLAATLTILGMHLANQIRTNNTRWSIYATVLVIAIVTWAIHLTSFFDYAGTGTRNWFPTEWSELFIALGIFSYAVSLYVENFSQK